MPITLANQGEVVMTQRVGGSQEIKNHLADLGFVPGADVSIITEIGGNLIVNVKESRVAISKEMARRIMV